MRYKYLLAVVVMAGAVQTASAVSAAYFDSQNSFSVSVDPFVTIMQDPGNGSGQYYFLNAQNQLWIPQATGDGLNTNNNIESYEYGPGDGLVYAQGQSYSAVSGMATQSNGENYNLIFTNTSTASQSFTLNLTVLQHLGASGYSQADAYGGWEINYYSTFDYFTNTLSGNGTQGSSYVGFTGGLVAPGTYQGTDTVTYTLAAAGTAGDTAQVQVWASGDTFAQSPATPEPFTMALAAAGLGLALARRRRRA